jgi:hypothetical protein
MAKVSTNTLRQSPNLTRLAKRIQKKVRAAQINLRHSAQSVMKTIRQRRARLWHQYYFARYYAVRWATSHVIATTATFLIALIILSAFATPEIQIVVGKFFGTNDRLGTLRNFLVTLGGALVGATAIGFSVVMFAVQMNFARTPYGLFRKLSSDFRLLGAFAATFFLALGVGAASLIPDVSWVAKALVFSGWATVLILVLFLYAYRRALKLINPLQQINFIVARARNDMKAWSRSARRARPLLEIAGSSKKLEHTPQRLRSSHDMPLAFYFKANPHWTAVSQQALTHLISFSRRYAEEGDHEIAGQALSAVLTLNTDYVAAKGKTFFADQLMFHNPLATDGFINETLEHLRQSVRIGITRGDEKQIEQTFRAIAGLLQIYTAIDYSDEYTQGKQHAQLAAGYLSAAVEAVLPHNMSDVIIEGVRLMGQCAQLLLQSSTPNEVVTLTGKIATISCSGIIKEDFRPVTLNGMEQLARLTFNLLLTEGHDIHFAAGELKKNVALLVKVFLTVPDSPLFSGHSAYLAPYYSLTTTEALAGWLTNLTNELLRTKPEDKRAIAVIHNIEQWSEELYQTEKEFLLLAIKGRSQFSFDMLHWIAHVTKLFFAISQAPACDDHSKEKLIRHACWLISVVSWIPHDKDTVSFVENIRITEVLFEAALDARASGCDEVFDCARDLLADWAFKAGRHHVGWGILERSMYGLATLALSKNDIDGGPQLKATIALALAKKDSPDQELRDRAAREIRHRAKTLYRPEHWSSRIDNAMTHINPEKLGPLLIEIANLLSPATANEPIRSDYF